MQSPTQPNCDEYGRLAIAKTMPKRRSYNSPAAHSLPCDTLRRKHSLSPRIPRRNQSEDSFFTSITNDCFSLPEEENSRYDDSSVSSTRAKCFPMTTVVCSRPHHLKEEDEITSSDASSLVSTDDIAASYYREERWNTPNRELVFAAAAPRRLPSSTQQRQQQRLVVVRAHSCNATINLHLRRDCFPVKPMRLRSTSQIMTSRRPTSFSGIIVGSRRF